MENLSKQEVERQLLYMDKIKEINKEFERENNRKPKMIIQTFGCQMNAHDSEKLKGILEKMGYEETDTEDNADFVIYNTCCVRENAENKVYGNLGYLKHLKEEKPHLKIALCGCMMQQDIVLETIRKKYRHVDIVFGTFNFHKLAELLYTNIETNAPVFDIWKEHGEIIEDLPTIRKQSFKASVNIMYGCDNFCSYCIVPYVRGRERSRKSEDIIKEIRTLAKDGVKEITLLGQNVNSYGKNLEEKITFAQLLEKVSEVEGIERIRFMTSHPKDLSQELIEAMKNLPKVCNHIHLPFQAGNNEILKKMNRKYTKEDYLSLVERIKEAVPDIAITTDIIVGYPGESFEEVKDTIDVIEKVGFNSAFTFIYSKRTGTPAANMEQVDEEVKKQNFNKVLEVLNPVIHDKTKAHIGKTYPVLCEGLSGDNKLYSGRLTDNSLVHFRSDRDYTGEIIDVRITDSKTFYLIGEIV